MSTTSTKVVYLARVALNLPDKPADLVTYSTHVVSSMTGNAAFPSPNPQLATVTAAINGLQTAQTAVLGRAPGAVATRDQKQEALALVLRQVGAYVQTVADATPENGASIIQGAGLSVRKAPTRGARAFAASQGAVSGSAHLVAVVAAHRASYEWESSIDGGKTWVAAPGTLKASTTITGLPVGTAAQFRYRPITKAGEGDWSQAVVLVVK